MSCEKLSKPKRERRTSESRVKKRIVHKDPEPVKESPKPQDNKVLRWVGFVFNGYFKSSWNYAAVINNPFFDLSFIFKLGCNRIKDMFFF